MKLSYTHNFIQIFIQRFVFLLFLSLATAILLVLLDVFFLINLNNSLLKASFKLTIDLTIISSKGGFEVISVPVSELDIDSLTNIIKNLPVQDICFNAQIIPGNNEEELSRSFVHRFLNTYCKDYFVNKFYKSKFGKF